MNELEDIDFSIDKSAPAQRGAYRAHVRGLQARVEDDGALYEVHDVSAAGFSMAAPLNIYELGRILSIHLEVNGKVIVPSLQARIVRLIPVGLVACSLYGLSRQQEYAMDKLVLEIQKRQIARQKNLDRQTQRK